MKQPDLKFSDTLTATRRLRALSQTETAKLLGVPIRLYRKWERGTEAPAEALFEPFCKLILDSGVSPTTKKTAEAKRSHIYWEKDRGWSTRFTIDLGPKKKGKRLRVRLRTKILEEAIQRFDLLMAAYRQLGLTINLRTKKVIK